MKMNKKELVKQALRNDPALFEDDWGNFILRCEIKIQSGWLKDGRLIIKILKMDK